MSGLTRVVLRLRLGCAYRYRHGGHYAPLFIAYHPQPGWLLEAFCLDRQATRDFLMAGMVSPWRPRQEATT